MNWILIIFIVLLCAGFAVSYILSGEEAITKNSPHQAHDDIVKYKWTNRAFAKQWLDLMSHDPADLDQYVVYTEQLVKKYTRQFSTETRSRHCRGESKTKRKDNNGLPSSCKRTEWSCCGHGGQGTTRTPRRISEGNSDGI